MVVVGLGQAGGNLATEFSRLGYRALALNTAHTDLSSLSGNDRHSLSAEQRIYVGIDGYDGAGADMNYGRECIQENAERIREAVAQHTEGADVVILTAGLGGGTGSAVCELVRVLEVLNLPIIVLSTLPNEYESGIAKVNAVRAVSELVKQQNIGWIFADNSRLSHIHGGVSLDKYFAKVNSVIIGPLDNFNRLNSRRGVYPIRTLDGEDFRALLLSNGVINYSENTLSALTVDAVIDRVRENLSTSSMMPNGFSPEEVSYMGVVLEAGEEVLRGTPFSFFEQLNEQLKHETGGGAIYMGVYRTEQPVDGGSAMLRMIASTQSLPAGIQGMVNDARREGGTLRDKLQRSMSALDLGEIEEFDLFRTSLRTGHGGSATRRRPSQPQLAVPDTPFRREPRKVGGSREVSERGARDPEPDPGSSPASETKVGAKPSIGLKPAGSPSAEAASASAEAAAVSAEFQDQPPASSSSTTSEAAEAAAGPSQEAEAEATQAEATQAEGPASSEPPDATAEAAAPAEAADEELSSELAAEEETAVLDADELVEEADELLEEDTDVEGRMDAESAEVAEAAEPSRPSSLVLDPLDTGAGPAPGGVLTDAQRQAEAASYQKLVATFLRTEFDSTKRRVARRLDAARKSEDAVSRELADAALERLRQAGQMQAFEEVLEDNSVASL